MKKNDKKGNVNFTNLHGDCLFWVPRSHGLLKQPDPSSSPTITDHSFGFFGMLVVSYENNSLIHAALKGCHFKLAAFCK